jgi:hypothetical protein
MPPYTCPPISRLFLKRPPWPPWPPWPPYSPPPKGC